MTFFIGGGGMLFEKTGFANRMLGPQLWRTVTLTEN